MNNPIQLIDLINLLSERRWNFEVINTKDIEPANFAYRFIPQNDIGRDVLYLYFAYSNYDVLVSEEDTQHIASLFYEIFNW